MNDGDRYELEAGLNAAAKFIAAEALRQAAKVVIDDAYEEKSGSPSREDWATADGAEITGEWLERMADELEADAAFTDMVQLGQEIGDE